jgi:hypothetical protein
MFSFSMAVSPFCWPRGDDWVLEADGKLFPAFGAYLDFALALLPLTFVVELNMSVKRRIALCVLLGLGVL